MHLVHKMHKRISDDSGRTYCRRMTCGEMRPAEIFSRYAYSSRRRARRQAGRVCERPAHWRFSNASNHFKSSVDWSSCTSRNCLRTNDFQGVIEALPLAENCPRQILRPPGQGLLSQNGESVLLGFQLSANTNPTRKRGPRRDIALLGCH